MLTLSLLRHAKSSWDDPALGDFDRPLAKRGAKAAPRMGAFMAARGLSPDLILCSTAERARATLALVLGELEADAEVRFDESLYLAEAPALLARVRGIEDEVTHALIVGHNPGLHALALMLAGAGPVRDLARLAAKFPTAALVVLTFEVPGWSRVAPGSGRLQLFMTPRRLP